MSAEERRSFPRYPIELSGQIRPAGGDLRPCELRDYCAGGLLVRHRGVSLQVGDPIEIVTKLLTPAGRKSLRIPARVAWLKEEWLGAALRQPAHSLVERLRQHEELQGRAKDEPGGIRVTEARGLAKLRHAALGALPGLFEELLTQVASGLLDSTLDAGSNREQQRLYEEMNAFDALRCEGSADLVRSLLDLALSSPGSSAAPPAAAGDALALVDPDEFERWLEASTVASRLDDLFISELQALERCGVGRPGKASADHIDVPFNPHHFTSVLKDLAVRLAFASPARKVLFGVAERLLAERLGEFYAELQKTLASLAAKAAPAGSRSKKPARQPPSDVAAKDPDRAEERGDKPPAPAAQDMASAPAAAVAHPQRAGAGAERAAAPQAQRAALADDLMQQVTRAVDVSGSLAGWLQKLQEPLRREAASDERFFLNREHPLRSLIDRLGHLQMFRPQPEPPADKDAIARTVAGLLEELARGQPDEEEYRKAAGQIGGLVDSASQKFQHNVERVVAAVVGRDGIRRARHQVVDELNRRYADRQVPRILRDLLEAGWRAVLELTYLRSGAKSEALARRFDLLDAVVGLLGGDAYAEAWRAASPERVLDELHQELASGSFDPLRRRAIEARLRADLRDPQAAGRDLIRMAPLVIEDGEVGVAAPPEGISAKAWERLQVRVAELAVGDRVRLLDAPQGQQDLRLVWIRDDRQVYSLVDYRGIPVRDLTLAELTQGLHRQRIEHERVDGRTLSERAADAMLAHMEERIAYQAAHDSLTGLLNRLQFDASLQQRLASTRTAAQPGVLLLIDVDHFHLINSVHGYEAGDRLLIGLARLLERRCGEGNLLGHHGGDRFALLVPELDVAGGERHAKAICGWIAGFPSGLQGPRRGVTVSIGVVDLADAPEGSGHALRAAEAAVEAAKSAGGNRSYRYRPDDPEITRRQESARWIGLVDDALEHGRLRLRCQPIVPVQGGPGRVPHYEVLLGVEDAQGQSLSIGDFITAAEAYKRIAAVDRWVTRATFEWVAAHRDKMPELHGFAVNLSGQTVGDATFVDFVRDLFRENEIRPEWISFEVTETAVIGDLSHTAAIIRAIKELGCAVALDDFGSGLASYSYLKELPVDWLKIDGVFVRNLATDQNDFAVVRSINEIAHFMGMRTIAEYVVDAQVLEKIRSLGVDFAQGFGIAPPCLLDDLLKPEGAAALNAVRNPPEPPT